MGAGVDTLLIAVLGASEVASALEEAGISAKQLQAAVEELRGSSSKASHSSRKGSCSIFSFQLTQRIRHLRQATAGRRQSAASTFFEGEHPPQ